MRIIFLDIDGVLNGHDWCDGAKSNTIRKTAVEAFNHVLAEVKPKIVISSAWRYMILGGAMTTSGFEYMLRTHGVCGIAGNILGTTPSDEDVPERGAQIAAWRERNGHSDHYVVVDDEDFLITKYGHPLIQTDGKTGMTMHDSDRIIGHFAYHTEVDRVTRNDRLTP